LNPVNYTAVEEFSRFFCYRQVRRLRSKLWVSEMAEKPKASLQQELDCYESNKADWLNAHLGEFALVGRKGAVGFYPTYEAAFEAGLKAFGIGTDFLIKQVVEHEPVFVIY
jgi:hypothetical protein